MAPDEKSKGAKKTNDEEKNTKIIKKKRTFAQTLADKFWTPKEREWWEDPPVQVPFNLPGIKAKIQRLMGSNVVRLTDRKYMQSLRAKFSEDYDREMEKRIKKREEAEKERFRQAIFKGSCSLENCPPSLIVAHSFVLATAMELERNRIIQNTGEKLPKELNNHPVFNVNYKTNSLIAARRAKVKTITAKNIEKLVSQGKKWARETIICEEVEGRRQHIARVHKKKQQKLEEQYKAEDPQRGLDVLRIHDDSWDKCELDLKDFLQKFRMAAKDRYIRQRIQYTSDPQDIRNKMLMAQKQRKEKTDYLSQNQYEQPIYSDSTILTDTSEAEEMEGISSGSSREGEQIEDAVQAIENLTEQEYLKLLEREVENDAQKGKLATKSKFNLMFYEDPILQKIKNAKTIKELFKHADDEIQKFDKTEK